MGLKMKFLNKTIYWRNPEKNYAFEAIGRIEIGPDGLEIVYNSGIVEKYGVIE